MKILKILLFVLLIILIVVVPIYTIKPLDFFSDDSLSNWANIATYLSVFISIVSVVLIYLTYQNQVTMSSVLQFESTFFQWYQIHVNLVKDLQVQIEESIEKTVMPKLQNNDFTNTQDLSVFKQLANEDIARPLHQYYRSMYHLFKYIYLSPFLDDYDQRKKYYDIIQSNMTDKEMLLFLCFVFGDTNLNKPVFKRKKLFKKQPVISFFELIDKGHILKNCYVPDPVLLRQMTPIVRLHFRQTRNSFHFFTAITEQEHYQQKDRET